MSAATLCISSEPEFSFDVEDFDIKIDGLRGGRIDFVVAFDIDFAKETLVDEFGEDLVIIIGLASKDG